MKQKTLTIIFSMIFLIGIITSGVLADRIISNTEGIYINDFIAGSTATANFSFEYLDYPENPQDSPLIIRLNISCLDENYPVWKNDFELSGYIKRYYLFGLLYDTITLECHENSPLTINHPLGSNTLNVPDGTFYCYNVSKDLRLDKHDDVFLNIKSDPALYPGTYNLTAEFFYVEDSIAPIVNITNKNYFETTYFRELSHIEITATIEDNVGIADYWGVITAPQISIDDKHKEGDVYHLSKILPIDTPEGNWEMKVFAEDTNGNIGEDNTILMIDRTAPNIHAIQPSGSYDEIIYIELNVTDEKSGVDDSSVKYRIRQMVPGFGICPESGQGIDFTCYNSGWLPTVYNSTTGHYHDEFDSTILPEGEYWFEAKAKDILGNEGVLE